MNNKTLVLCSGGLDSVVAAALLKHHGHNITLCYIDYGSVAQPKEKQCVHRCGLVMEAPVAIVPFSTPLWKTSPLVEQSANQGQVLAGLNAWVPARNLVLLSLASAFAAVEGFGYLAIGNIKGGVYGDNKREFTDCFDDLLEYAVAPTKMRCIAPLVDYTKNEVVKLGAQLRVPFAHTWSCYRSLEVHCGLCASCVSRRKAFIEMEIDDPATYQFPL